MAIKILKNRPSCIFLPKMSAYRKYFDETKYMYSLVKDDKLLEKEFGKKLKIVSKKILIVNQYTMENI